ncbi:hypothetical protein VDGL01_11741 [Verticillium dahliae]
MTDMSVDLAIWQRMREDRLEDVKCEWGEEGDKLLGKGEAEGDAQGEGCIEKSYRQPFVSLHIVSDDLLLGQKQSASQLAWLLHELMARTKTE